MGADPNAPCPASPMHSRGWAPVLAQQGEMQWSPAGPGREDRGGHVWSFLCLESYHWVAAIRAMLQVGHVNRPNLGKILRNHPIQQHLFF